MTRRNRNRRPARLTLDRLEDRTVPSGAPITAAGYGHLPLTFQANRGQAVAGFDFLSQGGDYAIALAPTQAALAVTGPNGDAGIRITLAGANPNAVPIGVDPLATKTNYLVGSNPSQWHTGIANYGEVEYQGVYHGIDVTYYGTSQSQLEYDFTVAAGADPSAIRLAVQGMKSLSLDGKGELVLHTGAGDLTEEAPVVYQMVHGVRKAVAGSFVLEGGNQVGFKLGAYDHSKALVIDPVLDYSSYLDGSGIAIAVDSAGEAFVTGSAPAGFPTTSGSFGTSGAGVYVAKLNATGTGVVYATYIGNAGSNLNNANIIGGYGIALDAAGDAAVMGAAAVGFPTTANALATTGATNEDFVAELNPTGTGLTYSSYLPGTSGAAAFFGVRGAIAVDSAGDLDVTGAAGSGFITTASAIQTTGGVFFTRINPTLSGTASLLYSTLLGGGGTEAGTGIAVDGSGNAYLTGFTNSASFATTAGAFQPTNHGGYNAFVAKVNPALSGAASLLYSTYLGGSGGNDGRIDPYTGAAVGPFRMGTGIAVDAAGDAYVTGSTNSQDFPVTAGAFQTVNHSPSTGIGITTTGDAFLTKLNPTGTALVYSTYFGGTGRDSASGVAVDAAGDATIVGTTYSLDLPMKNPIQGAKAGATNTSDAFVATFNPSGSSLQFSSYLGGTANDLGFGVALDSSGNAYVTGQTNYQSTTSDFPTTGGAYQRTTGTGFVFKVDAPAAAQPTLAVTGFPATLTAGASGTFTITARDANGNVLTGYSGTVHFTSSDPQAVLPADYTFTAADQGVHTFAATLKTAGSQSLIATDMSVPSLGGSQTGITVTPSTATHFAIAAPVSVTAGTAFGIGVEATDAYGNAVTTYTGTIHFSSSDPKAVLPANYTVTAGDNGGDSPFGLKLKTKGVQTITVVDTHNGSLIGSCEIAVE